MITLTITLTKNARLPWVQRLYEGAHPGTSEGDSKVSRPTGVGTVTMEKQKERHSRRSFLLLTANSRTSRLADVVDEPLANLLGAVLGATLNLDFGCAYVGVERGVYSLTDEGAFGLEVEVLEEHGY